MSQNEKTAAYLAGYDCGLNGPTQVNCHFGFFSSPESTKKWEEGKKTGDKEKDRIIKKSQP